MTISVDLFDSPEKYKIIKIFVDSPIYNFQLEEELFNLSESDVREAFPIQLEINDFKHTFNNRLVQANFNYAYAIAYYNRGISDQLLLKGITNEEWSNKIHFENYLDNYFQKLFTSLDILSHILINYYELRNKKGKVIYNPDWNKALNGLKCNNKHHFLGRKLQDISERKYYKEAKLIRDNIMHNQPPYRAVMNYEKTESGVYAGGITYTTSKELRSVMDEFVFSVLDIIDTIKFYEEI